MRKVHVILPRSEEYKLLTDVEKLYMSDCVKNWISEFTSNGFRVECFYEDFVALNLLGKNKDIQWVTVLGQSDELFLLGNVEDIPEVRKEVNKTTINNSIIREAVKKFPVSKGCDKLSRFYVMQKRLRYVTMHVLKQSRDLIVVDNKHGYEKATSSEAGDGRLKITISSKRLIDSVELGGFTIPKESVSALLKMRGVSI